MAKREKKEVYSSATDAKFTAVIVSITVISLTFTTWNLEGLLNTNHKASFIALIGSFVLSVVFIGMTRSSEGPGGVWAYMGLDYRQDFDRGYISDDLRLRLKLNGVLLPTGATVLTVRAGKEWRILINGEVKYLVRNFVRRLALSEFVADRFGLQFHEGEVFMKPATVILDETFEPKTTSSRATTAIRIQKRPRPPIPDKVRKYFKGTKDEEILYIYLPDEYGEFNIPAWIDGNKVRDITEFKRNRLLTQGENK